MNAHPRADDCTGEGCVYCEELRDVMRGTPPEKGTPEHAAVTALNEARMKPLEHPYDD